MKKIIGVICFFVFLIFGCTNQNGSNSVDKSQDNVIPQPESSQAGSLLKRAPQFELLDENQKKWVLSDFKGRVILIHFWATWCGPCIDELPEIFSFVKGFHKEKDFELVAINLDESWEEAKKSLPKKILPERWVSLIDSKMVSSHEYGSFQFPETYLISKDQNVVTKWIGPQKWSDPYFKNIIQKELTAKP